MDLTRQGLVARLPLGYGWFFFWNINPAGFGGASRRVRMGGESRTTDTALPPPATGEGLSPAQVSPETLLEQFVAGKEEAFTMLVGQIGDRLFGFILRFMGNRHAAEDVYQTVLVKVATHASSFDRRARLSTWVYRIARNACLDAVRKSGRRKTVSLDAALDAETDRTPIDMMAAVGPGPDEDVTRKELRSRIAAAVETLPDDQREVFLLKEDGELTFDEIGELVGCGKETAKSRMRYAMKRLQNALGAEGRLYGLSGAGS